MFGRLVDKVVQVMEGVRFRLNMLILLLYCVRISFKIILINVGCFH